MLACDFPRILFLDRGIGTSLRFPKLVAREPYGKNEARKRVAEIVNGRGTVVLSGHAKKEMAADELTMLDVEMTLKTGRIHEEAEERDGTWRYRLRGTAAAVVVSFESDEKLVVVTVWKETNR